MLPKGKRLKRADFSKRALRRATFEFGSVTFIPGEAKAAVVVSKKISLKATVRNTLRRRIFGILKNTLPQSGIRESIIVYPNKKALAASFTTLSAELSRALTR